MTNSLQDVEFSPDHDRRFKLNNPVEMRSQAFRLHFLTAPARFHMCWINHQIYMFCFGRPALAGESNIVAFKISHAKLTQTTKHQDVEVPLCSSTVSAGHFFGRTAFVSPTCENISPEDNEIVEELEEGQGDQDVRVLFYMRPQSWENRLGSLLLCNDLPQIGITWITWYNISVYSIYDIYIYTHILQI